MRSVLVILKGLRLKLVAQEGQGDGP